MLLLFALNVFYFRCLILHAVIVVHQSVCWLLRPQMIQADPSYRPLFDCCDRLHVPSTALNLPHGQFVHTTHLLDPRHLSAHLVLDVASLFIKNDSVSCTDDLFNTEKHPGDFANLRHH